MVDTNKMWHVVGHEAAVILLSRSLDEGKLSHAYIFVGPRRVGKTVLAINLAQAVNCQATGNARPCKECSQCQRIAQMRHPDVQIIDRYPNTNHSGSRNEIGIDQVREVQRAAMLRPYEGKSRVFIFQEAHAMTPEASNALLKLLEEPPDSVLLVLLTSNSASILPTILSRCQHISLNPLPMDTIADELHRVSDIPSMEAVELAKLSSGSIGWALEAAQNPDIVSQFGEELERFATLIESGVEKRFAYAQEMANIFGDPRSRETAIDRLRTTIEWWRYLLLVKEASFDLPSNVLTKDTLQRIGQWISTPHAVKAIRSTQETIECLEANVNPRLALEVLMLSLPLQRSNKRDAR